jgi:hypothetical protein
MSVSSDMTIHSLKHLSINYRFVGWANANLRKPAAQQSAQIRWADKALAQPTRWLN